MKRFVLAVTTAAVIALGASGPALGDAGAPGTTFPEQPGSHVQNGCQAVSTNPGTGPGGAMESHASPTAGEITTGLFTDACVE